MKMDKRPLGMTIGQMHRHSLTAGRMTFFTGQNNRQDHYGHAHDTQSMLYGIGCFVM